MDAWTTAAPSHSCEPHHMAIGRDDSGPKALHGSTLRRAWDMGRLGAGQAFVSFFTMAWFPAVVALSGAVAGAWVSIYSTEMKASVPMMVAANPLSAYSFEAKTGWGLFLLFFLLFAMQQTATNRRDANARAELVEESNRLKKLVERLETLPPAGFLQKFQSLYQELVHLYLLPLSDNLTKQSIEEDIRSVLKAIASLARKYDNAPEHTVYVANLMLCRSREQVASLSQAEQQLLESRLVFCPELATPKCHGLGAILDTVAELSSDYVGGAASHTPAIVLPIPMDRLTNDLGPERGTKFRVLPGAPFAAATHQYAAFDSIQALLKWCAEKADLTQATVTEIQAFFYDGPGKDIKSFIAVPICLVVDSSAEPLQKFGGLPKPLEDEAIPASMRGSPVREDCLAVLNVHTFTEKILRGNGYPLFLPIIEPFCKLLSILLVLYETRTWTDDDQAAIISG